MIGSATVVAAADWPGWLVPALVGVAGVSLLCRRLLPGALVWMGFVLPISAVVGLEMVRFWPAPGGAVQDVARVCAVLALFWSVCAGVVLRRRSLSALQTAGRRSGPWTRRFLRHGAVGSGDPTYDFVGLAHIVALQLGVVAAVIQSVVLAMRMIHVAVELLSGHPPRGAPDYGFGAGGLWTLGFVFAACAITLMSTRARRLWTCLLWSAIILASWACLLAPVVRSTTAGGFERTGSTLVLLGALSILLALAVMISRRPWPGLSLSATVIAVAVILLVCCHLAVPVAVGRGGFRLGALVVTGSAALAAFACFLLLGREWSVSLADAGMGLTSLSLCGLATLAVPPQPATLAERYPMIFSAMIVGLALATGLWTHLACAWRQQLDRPQAWVASSRLIPRAKRFAFVSAAFALVLGAIMAAWPRWPGIAAMDDSIGRVTAGFAANLFLLLVMLWCSRRLHKLTFQILTVLTVVSTAGFLMIRMLPFTSTRFR